MDKKINFIGIIIFIMIIGFLLIGCGFSNDDDTSGTGGNSGSGGNSRENAISVTVGYSASHTISSGDKKWFKFIGDGNPVIFETRGSVVATAITIFEENSIVGSQYTSGGEGSNALHAQSTTSGRNYFIHITARNSTNGTYTFVVTAPTSNLRTNPITVSVGENSSHIIYSSGTHWFSFTGDGERVFFETGGNVVTSSISIYEGEGTSSIFSGTNGVNFITVSERIYNIKITGNAGTYTFNIRHGTGDGSSRYDAIEVSKGYSSSHTITSSGQHWFVFQGTGNSVTFKTTGNVVATAITIFEGNSILGTQYTSGGEGSNALRTQSTTSGRNYFIRISARSNTSGTYTFVVE